MNRRLVFFVSIRFSFKNVFIMSGNLMVFKWSVAIVVVAGLKFNDSFVNQNPSIKICTMFSYFSNRTLVATILICLFLLYLSFTFNSCLMPTIRRSLQNVSTVCYSSCLHLDNSNFDGCCCCCCYGFCRNWWRIMNWEAQQLAI